MDLSANNVRAQYRAGGFNALNESQLIKLAALEPGMFKDISSEYTRRKAYDQPLKTMRTSRDIYEYLRPHYEGLNEDRSLLLMVNRKNQPIGVRLLSIGGLDGTIVDQRKIFKELLLTERCTGFAISHNHPSENCSPSDADRKITSLIYKASVFMNYTMLDHIIVCSTNYYSFADEGTLTN